MKLEIQNFGPIKQAEIDIGKITVIAGPNASGKTISSKLLYCLLASVSSDGEYLANSGIQNLFVPLLFDLAETIREDNETASDQLRKISLRIMSSTIPQFQNKPLESYFNEAVEIFERLNFENKELFQEKIDKINERFKNKKKANIFEQVFDTLLGMEFGKKQLSSIFNNGSVKFQGEHNKNIFKNEFTIRDNIVDADISDEYLKYVRVNQISYIETPYIFEFMYPNDTDFIFNMYHQRLLMKKLIDTSIEEDVYDKIENKAIIKCQEQINKIINGKFKYDAKTSEFELETDNYSITTKNISAGLKQLGMIQLLLNNRKLVEDSFLIMDEPEVHLHPEWQIKLAEIIVLLAKNLNITVYINSHSPQFIEAIEVYSDFFEIKKDTNFYLTKKNESDGKFDFKKIDNNELHIIYKNLGEPYTTLDEVIGGNLANQFKGCD